MPGVLVIRAGHLHFRQGGDAGGGLDVTLDLTLDLTYDSSDMVWKGSFSDPFFSGQVALRRPRMSDPIAPAGTWRTYSNEIIWPAERARAYGCINIGVGDDEETTYLRTA